MKEIIEMLLKYYNRKKCIDCIYFQTDFEKKTLCLFNFWKSKKTKSDSCCNHWTDKASDRV